MMAWDGTSYFQEAEKPVAGTKPDSSFHRLL